MQLQYIRTDEDIPAFDMTASWFSSPPVAVLHLVLTAWQAFSNTPEKVAVRVLTNGENLG